MKLISLSKVTTFLTVAILVSLLVMVPVTARTVSASSGSGTSSSILDGAGTTNGYTEIRATGESVVYDARVDLTLIGRGHNLDTTPDIIVNFGSPVQGAVHLDPMTAEVTITGGTVADVNTGTAAAGSSVTIMSNHTPSVYPANDLTGVSVSADISSHADAITGTRGLTATATSSGGAEITGSGTNTHFGTPDGGITSSTGETYTAGLTVDGSTSARAAVTQQSSGANAESSIYAGAGASTPETGGIGNYAFAGMDSNSTVFRGTGTARSSATGVVNSYAQYVSGTNLSVPFMSTNAAQLGATWWPASTSTDVSGSNLNYTAGDRVWARSGMAAESVYDDIADGTTADFVAQTESGSSGSNGYLSWWSRNPNMFASVANAYSDGYGRASTTGDTYAVPADELDSNIYLWANADVNLRARTRATGTGVTTANAGVDSWAGLDTTASTYDGELTVTGNIADTQMWAETSSRGTGTSYIRYPNSYSGSADSGIEGSAEARQSNSYYYNGTAPVGTALQSGTISTETRTALGSLATAANLAGAWDYAHAESLGAIGDWNNYVHFDTNWGDLLTYSQMSNDANATSGASSGTSSAAGGVDGQLETSGRYTYQLTGNWPVVYPNVNSEAESKVIAEGQIGSNAAASGALSLARSVAAVESQQCPQYHDATNLGFASSSETNSVVVSSATGPRANAAAGVNLYSNVLYAAGSYNVALPSAYPEHSQSTESTADGSMRADVSVVDGTAIAMAETNTNTTTGQDTLTNEYFSGSSVYSVTQSYGQSGTSRGQVSASSGINHASLDTTGFNDVNVTGHPIVQSHSDLFADARNSVSVAGAPRSALLPRYNATALTTGYGNSFANWTAADGVFASSQDGLSSQAQMYVPLAGRVPVQAHAETSQVDINNFAQAHSDVAGNVLAQARNRIVHGNALVDINGNIIRVTRTSGFSSPVINTAISPSSETGSTVWWPNSRGISTATSPFYAWTGHAGGASSDVNAWNPVTAILSNRIQRVPF